MAKLCHELGNALAHLGERRKSEKVYRHALKVFELLAAEHGEPPIDEQDASIIFLHLGHVHLALKQFNESANAYRRTLEFFPNPSIKLGHALWGLAKATRGDEAELAYFQAIDVFERLSVTFPNSLFCQQEVGCSYVLLGDFLFGLDRLQEAVDAYQRGLSTFQNLSSGSPDNTRFRIEVVNINSRIGEAFEGLGRKPEARAAYSESLDALHRLAVDYPEENEYYADDLVGALTNLTRTSTTEQAEQAHRKALEVSEKLSGQFPDRLSYRHSTGWLQFRLGELLLGNGKVRDAQTAYRQAVDTLQPHCTDSANNQSSACETLGHALWGLARTSDPAMAEIAYRQALSVFEKLSTKTPTIYSFSKKPVRAIIILASCFSAEADQTRPRSLTKRRSRFFNLLSIRIRPSKYSVFI